MKEIITLLLKEIEAKELMIKVISGDLNKQTEQLKKLKSVIEPLRELNPELFEEVVGNAHTIDFISAEVVPFDPTWDIKQSFRTRVKTLLRSMGRYSKVSELAKIAMSKEPIYSSETEESLQEKISRTLTALRKIPSTRIVKRKIHSGSAGVAWGYKDWLIDAEKELILKYETEKQIKLIIKDDENIDKEPF